jgi:hypothetical protein
MRSLGRMAAANGKALEELAEERLWRKVLSTGNRE